MKTGLIQENQSGWIDAGYPLLELGSLFGIALAGYFCLFL
jgi:hypothetical protein